MSKWSYLKWWKLLVKWFSLFHQQPAATVPLPWRWYVVTRGEKSGFSLSDNTVTRPHVLQPLAAGCGNSTLWVANVVCSDMLMIPLWKTRFGAFLGVEMFADLPPACVYAWFRSKPAVETDFVCFVCLLGRRITTMSTQNVTARDLGGEWPSHRTLGPVLDCRSQCEAQNAVSWVCVEKEWRWCVYVSPSYQ